MLMICNFSLFVATIFQSHCHAQAATGLAASDSTQTVMGSLDSAKVLFVRRCSMPC